MSAETERPE